jgi:signal transduction histidine kinase
VRGRIVTLAVSAAVLALVLFGIPLAVAVAAYYVDDARAELEQGADTAALTVVPDLVRGTVPRTLPNLGPDTTVALYGTGGTRRTGTGPPTVSVPTEPDRVVEADTDSELVLLSAVSDGDQVVGVVRVATPRGAIYQRAVVTWLVMAGLGVVAVAGVWLLARRQARRLARPLEDLSGAAFELGAGNFTVTTPRSGIAEIDSVGSSLDTTAQRLSDLVARERAFTADASHQLRTPLAGLRLELEAALDLPDEELRPSITAALESADQLEGTIADLLDLARNVPARAGLGPVGELLDRLDRDWRGLLAERGRTLRVAVPDTVAGRLVVAPVLRQIVAVLLDNALRHGAGTVTVAARDLGSAVGVDVSDEGEGVTGPDPLAGRVRGDVAPHPGSEAGLGPGAPAPRVSGNAAGGDRVVAVGVEAGRWGPTPPPRTSHGIGLPLARRLAEAESGRLWLATPVPPTFTLVLPTHGETG